MICVDAARNAVTCIGRLGENEAREVRINVSSIVRQFPGCTFTVLHKRPGDPDAYPVPAANVRTDGENVLWTVISGDLAREGIGQFEVRASVGGTVVKTIIYTSRVEHALDGSGEVPEPWEEWVTEVTDAADRAEAAAQLLENPGAEAETLEPGSQATAGYSDGTFTFGIPEGEKGDPGVPGQDGQDGYSPTLTVTDITGGYRVTITDASGTQTVDVMDGQDGQPGADGHSPVITTSKSGKTTTILSDGSSIGTVMDGTDGQDGQDGADGYSPSASVSKSGSTATITITDKTGTTSAQVSDGDPTTLIDDTAGDGTTNRTWSADKLTDEVGSLKSAINILEPSASAGDVGKVLKAKTVADGKVSEYEFGSLPSVPVQDVQVNGTSVLSQGVANVPQGSGTLLGVLYSAREQDVKAGDSSIRAIPTARGHIVAFYGLAKAAGADMASLSSVTVGQYPEAQKVAIQKMLGVYKAPYRLIKEITITEEMDRIYVNKDVDGNDFSLTDVIFQTINLVSTNSGNASISANSGIGNTPANGGFITIQNGCSTTAQNRVAIINIDGGRFFGKANNQSYDNTYSAKNYTVNQNASGIFECSEIYELCLASLNGYKFTSGTIKIYGR